MVAEGADVEEEGLCTVTDTTITSKTTATMSSDDATSTGEVSGGLEARRTSTSMTTTEIKVSDAAREVTTREVR